MSGSIRDLFRVSFLHAPKRGGPPNYPTVYVFRSSLRLEGFWKEDRSGVSREARKARADPSRRAATGYVAVELIQ